MCTWLTVWDSYQDQDPWFQDRGIRQSIPDKTKTKTLIPWPRHSSIHPRQNQDPWFRDRGIRQSIPDKTKTLDSETEAFVNEAFVNPSQTRPRPQDQDPWFRDLTYANFTMSGRMSAAAITNEVNWRHRYSASRWTFYCQQFIFVCNNFRCCSMWQYRFKI